MFQVLTDKHLLIIVLIIEFIMILLLTIGTAIPQTRHSPYYYKDKEYHPKKNVRERYTELYDIVYGIVLALIYNSHYETIVLIYFRKREFLLNIMA